MIQQLTAQYGLFPLVVNYLCHIADGALCIYLLSEVFGLKARWTRFRSRWLIPAVCFATLVHLVDLASGFGFYRYYAAVLAGLAVYAMVMLRGGVFSRLTMCVFYMFLLIFMESMASMISAYFDPAASPLLNLLLFLVKRIGMKIPLYFAVRFVCRHTITAGSPYFNLYWLVMSTACVAENIILSYIRRMPITSGINVLEVLIVHIACIYLPLCFCYLIYVANQKAEENKVYMAQAFTLRTQEQYLSQISDMTNSLRQFRHDYKAHLFCIDALVEEGRYDQLHEYLLSLHQIDDRHLILTQYTDNIILNSLLNQKRRAAAGLGVDFRVDMSLPGSCHISDHDLATLLTNLTDNALEACQACDGGYVRLSLNESKAYLKIRVENSTVADVLKENPALRTTKADAELHGMGLSILRKIVEQYDGLMKIESTDHTFAVTVLLLNAPTGAEMAVAQSGSRP